MLAMKVYNSYSCNSKVRTARHIFPLHCTEWKNRERMGRPLSYAEAFTRGGCDESIEVTVRLASFVARMGGNRLATARRTRV